MSSTAAQQAPPAPPTPSRPPTRATEGSLGAAGTTSVCNACASNWSARRRARNGRRRAALLLGQHPHPRPVVGLGRCALHAGQLRPVRVLVRPGSSPVPSSVPCLPLSLIHI